MKIRTNTNHQPYTTHQCSTNINNSRKSCQPMQKTRRKYHKKIFKWIKESKGEHTVNICELNILETLAKTLFPVKSSYIRITYRSCRRWMNSGRNITYECCVSQSVLYEVLNVVPDDVFKRKCLFNGEICFIQFLKRILKRLCY